MSAAGGGGYQIRFLSLFLRYVQRKYKLLCLLCSLVNFLPVPEFIDPVFTKTSPKRSFSLNRNRAFWLVFAKTGSIISGTGPSHSQSTYILYTYSTTVSVPSSELGPRLPQASVSPPPDQKGGGIIFLPLQSIHHTSFVDPHWFQCGSEASLFGQSGSSVLMTKNLIKNYSWNFFYSFDQNCNFPILRPPLRTSLSLKK